ncbi:MAG TPA: hypothetical protein PLP86_05895, partial [Armatimonadota bacterium]|nr:hypothetical protein [Armatimonadota bacterium]
MSCKALHSRTAFLSIMILLAVVSFTGISWSAEEESTAAEPNAEITTGPNGISVYAVGVQADEFFTQLARA